MTTATIPTIQPEALAGEMSRGVAITLIDVRTPPEFGAVHAAGARNVPLDRLDPKSLNAGGGAPVYVICKSGARAAKACQALLGSGLPEVISVEGGTDAWIRAGLPVVRGKPAMSLERQVRIAAGALVVIGVALGALVNPWCYAISAMVGAGLIFAGVTDTCGMGMLLAKMPWNRGEAPSCCGK